MNGHTLEFHPHTRKGRTTLYSILYFLTGAVFIDLRKAFDTVDHAVLLDKLSNLGIVDKEHGRFTDYLSNRSQVVKLQGVTSTPVAISVRVPQGSILGPLLFIPYINDLPKVVSECSILMYANDTVRFYTARPLKPLLFKTS